MFAFTHESGYTLGFRRKIAHNGLHAETGAFLPSATAWLRAASEIFLFRFSTSPTNAPRSLSRVKAGTHSAFGEGSHTAAYTPKQGAFRMGVVSLPSERSARSPTSPGRVSERPVLPLLGLGRGCSQRTQKAFGTAMRLCASLFRGVAAPLGCVIQRVRY